MTEHTHRTTLVLGGTGKTGSRIVQQLTARGIPTRVGTRSGTPPFDWENRATWAPALQGVGAVYVSYYPDLAVPGAPEAVRAFTETALEHGARRLVLLSGRGEEEAQRAERMLQESGAEWTIVRSAWFMQNFSEAFLVDSIRRGEVLGNNAYLTDGVQRALGRKPRDFTDYARDAATTDVWNTSQVAA